jgi:hypothetical protein
MGEIFPTGFVCHVVTMIDMIEINKWIWAWAHVV